ncbi:MAG: hypothetical protein ABIB71_07720 [Candidatus Woesearchaeota archaeon]
MGLENEVQLANFYEVKDFKDDTDPDYLVLNFEFRPYRHLVRAKALKNNLQKLLISSVKNTVDKFRNYDDKSVICLDLIRYHPVCSLKDVEDYVKLGNNKDKDKPVYIFDGKKVSPDVAIHLRKDGATMYLRKKSGFGRISGFLLPFIPKGNSKTALDRRRKLVETARDIEKITENYNPPRW